MYYDCQENTPRQHIVVFQSILVYWYGSQHLQHYISFGHFGECINFFPAINSMYTNIKWMVKDHLTISLYIPFTIYSKEYTIF